MKRIKIKTTKIRKLMKAQIPNESMIDSYYLSSPLLHSYFDLTYEKVKKEAKKLSNEFLSVKTLTHENYSKIITHSAYREFFFFDNEKLVVVNSKLSNAKLSLSELTPRARKTKEKILKKISQLEDRKLDLYSIALRRLQSYQYCSRKLSRLVLSEMLYVAQEKKQIGGQSGNAYATTMMKNYRKMQNDYNNEYLASKKIQIGNKTVSLLSVANNVEKRISELYAKVKGLENYANELGYNWAFLTMTVKPEFHANPTKGKSCWNKASAVTAHQQLKSSWDALGKEIANLGYPMSNDHMFGLRVVEPHKDGTPHWHLVLFYDKILESDNRVKLVSNDGLFAKHFAKHSKHALKIVIGQSQSESSLEYPASAATYCFKYITKALGGDHHEHFDIHTLDEHLQSSKINETIEYIDSWRAATRIRAYQLFGVKGKSNIWNATRKVAKSTGKLLVRKVNDKLKFEIKEEFIDFKHLKNELSTLMSEEQALRNSLSRFDAMTQEELEKYRIKPTPDNLSTISTNTIYLEKKHSPIDEHHSIDERHKQIELNGHLDLLEMYKRHHQVINIMKHSISGNFSEFIKACKTNNIELIKEEYTNKYGERKKKTIGINAGIKVYLFKKHIISKT